MSGDQGGHVVIAQSAGEAFLRLVSLLDAAPDFSVAPRGQETKEMLGVSVRIDNPYDRIVMTNYRRVSLKYLVGEWLWYERGSNSLEEISYYSKYWSRISDDQITANSAYGYRMFGSHPLLEVDQWERVKRQLIDEPATRRAVLLIALPEDVRSESRDVPCTLGLQFLVRDNRLHLVTYMRSNDVVLGFGYDVACFTLFQEKMLVELQEADPGLRMGQYLHFVTSMHLYKHHYELARRLRESGQIEGGVMMPRMKSLSEIRKLQANEALLRQGEREGLLELSDDFSAWCQAALVV